MQVTNSENPSNSSSSVQTFRLKTSKQKERPKIQVSEKDEKSENNHTEVIVGISSTGELQSLNPKKEDAPLVIPLSLQRTFLKKRTEVENGQKQKSEEEIKLDEEAKKAILAEALNTDEDQVVTAIPLLKQNTVPGLLDEEDEKKRLELDISQRPEEATLEGYEAMPISSFGEAALRGMGWEPGKPVGKNSKTVVVPIEFVRRHHRGGLGSSTLDDIPELNKKKELNQENQETQNHK
eukprot:c19806_g1_i1.p1 GENE.c19806_g1_i1~~c19806_g1_i1.p1  ORF type:complete len:237 (+),score=104.80 c19806_g1_i1:48-758(+)